MEFTIKKPHAVSFDIQLEGQVASPEKVTVIMEKLEKRLAVPECDETLKDVEEKIEKARVIRENKLKEKTRIL
jgi:hypothetical protein